MLGSSITSAGDGCQGGRVDIRLHSHGIGNENAKKKAAIISFAYVVQQSGTVTCFDVLRLLSNVMKCRNIGDPNEILLAALHIHSLHKFAGFACNVHLPRRLVRPRDSLSNNHSLRVYEDHHFSNRVLLRRQPVSLTNESHPASKVLQRAGKTIEKSCVR